MRKTLAILVGALIVLSFAGVAYASNDKAPSMTVTTSGSGVLSPGHSVPFTVTVTNVGDASGTLSALTGIGYAAASCGTGNFSVSVAFTPQTIKKGRSVMFGATLTMVNLPTNQDACKTLPILTSATVTYA